ncbi:MAG: S4 domain-containing protein, partial [Bacillota bacterium]
MALGQQGFYPSRQRAQAAIRAGLVSVNGRVVTRPSFPVTA